MQPFPPELIPTAATQWQQQILTGDANKQRERNTENAAHGKRGAARADGKEMKMGIIRNT